MRRTILALVLLAAPLQVLAQVPAKGPNGGPVVESHGHYVEMVSQGAELVLYLTEGANKPLASAGMKNLRAIVQDGGKTTTVTLAPTEPNKLVGTLPGPLGNGARVVVSGTLTDGHAIQARFVKN